MSDKARWPAPWVRAVLDLAILGTLTERPLHGYALAQALQDRGFGLLRGGSLYPVLARLEDAGLVVTSWVEGDAGPGRKDYDLTALGREHLHDGLADLRSLTDTLTTTITSTVTTRGTR